MPLPLLWIIVWLVLLVPPTPARGGDGVPITPAPGHPVLTLARVSDNPKEHLPRMQPLVNLVAARLAPLGIREGRVILARDNAEMIHLLCHGDVDWVSETAYSAFTFVRECGAEIALRNWRGGVSEYHTLFITRRDSGVDSLAALRGKRLALEDRGSTSGHRVPLAILRREGIGTVNMGKADDPVPADRVGAFIAGGELNIAAAVVAGKADAGTINNTDWENHRLIPPAYREQLAILHRSPPIPRALELLRRGLSPRIKEKLVTLLAGAHEDPEFGQALALYPTTRFERVNGPIRQELDEMRKLLLPHP